MCAKLTYKNKLWAIFHTLESFEKHLSLVVGEVSDRRRGGRFESVFLNTLSVSHLSCKCALVTLPVVQVVSRLRKVDVEAS